MEKLFGTDGIRGIFGQPPMTLPFLQDIARALATFFQPHFSKGPFFLAQDTRSSCPAISQHLHPILKASGAQVFSLGVCPTPGLIYMIRAHGACGGIMISASHNPAQYNGLKVFKSDGSKLNSQEQLTIQRSLQPQGTPSLPEDPPFFHKALDAYKQNLLQKASALDLFKGRIIVDCANGALSFIAPEVLKKTNAHIIPIHHKPNGHNINEECGATHPKALMNEVLKHKADLGIAFDGDGDRLVMCTKDHILDGDQILAHLASDFFKNESPGPKTVISTILANKALQIFLKKKGIKLHRTNVGDAHVMQSMQELNCPLGGEPSGHILFKEDGFAGDALFIALHLLKILSKNQEVQPQALFTPYAQVTKNIPIAQLKSSALQAINGIAKNCQSASQRVIIRPSGTEPVLRMMVENKEKNAGLKTLQAIERELVQ